MQFAPQEHIHERAAEQNVNIPVSMNKEERHRAGAREESHERAYLGLDRFSVFGGNCERCAVHTTWARERAEIRL